MSEESNEYTEVDLAIDLASLVLQLRPMYLKLPIFRNIRQMTYKKAITYFIENKPPISFKSGAMIIEKEDEDFNAFFVQVFLDEENHLVCDPITGKPYGRRCLIRGMSNELTRVFGDKQVVIVQ